MLSRIWISDEFEFKLLEEDSLSPIEEPIAQGAKEISNARDQKSPPPCLNPHCNYSNHRNSNSDKESYKGQDLSQSNWYSFYRFINYLGEQPNQVIQGAPNGLADLSDEESYEGPDLSQ
jgi:hypothetical protein